MSKVSFSSLKIKNEEKIKTFEFNDKVIEVLQYLPAEEKNNLIEVAIQKANDGTVFNVYALTIYFYLYIVMYYTNITFTEKQREDLLKLYDSIEQSGLLDQVLLNMDPDEFNLLKTTIEDTQKIVLEYNNSVNKIFDSFQTFAPDMTEKIEKELKDFDIDKYEKVINIARGAGAQI